MNKNISDFLVARSEAKKLAAKQSGRITFARRFIAGLLESYTSVRRDPPVQPFRNDLTKRMGRLASLLELNLAAYLIGTTYTMMLPDDFRKKNGVYYTPPSLVERLLDLADKAGVNWANARIIDPACGGGAFLAPVAKKIADSLTTLTPSDRLEHIRNNLFGIELDSFSAWMSYVFIDVALSNDIIASDWHPVGNILNGDSLTLDNRPNGKFDLIIGNPPYGKVRLSKTEREYWKRSLYGHANLYGLFSDLAIRLAAPNGIIAYVTPTSFLGGQYFKSLRSLFLKQAPPKYIDFITQRDGVFLDALQETLLAVYVSNDSDCEVNVSNLQIQEINKCSINCNGSYQLPDNQSNPWVLPRTYEQSLLVHANSTMPMRLRDLGYMVSTGPLVWNRHRKQLYQKYVPGAVPLIWAECVDSRGNGTFTYKATGRNHVPWYMPTRKDDPNIINYPCVLIQRTTSIEQGRRLLAAELPLNFIENRGGYVTIENHLNILRSDPKTKPAVSLRTIARLLNSRTVDQVFRCINGSTAVSAYELGSIPLPSPQDCLNIEQLLENNHSHESIERYIEELYKNVCLETAA